ncbi:hypothetical protein RvY_02036 [Ramazzottius varieornatus]|uniref:PAS domain-containing protein n=1 Tax=Ramazzottius varieornatus TaxID=947166 RepID=A0A1D1UID8_RAMVA|nr:hypothetical protein RvY_02036 [Ramazzottius varieornatus]
MPLQNSIAEALIRKFEASNRIFLICNTTFPLPRVIYSSERFQGVFGYSRPEVMQGNCNLKVLHGPLTDQQAIADIENGVQTAHELQVDNLALYKKDGTVIRCNVILAPVRNENSVVIMYLLNFEESDPDKTSSSSNGSKKSHEKDHHHHHSKGKH